MLLLFTDHDAVLHAPCAVCSHALQAGRELDTTDCPSKEHNTGLFGRRVSASSDSSVVILTVAGDTLAMETEIMRTTSRGLRRSCSLFDSQTRNLDLHVVFLPVRLWLQQHCTARGITATGIHSKQSYIQFPRLVCRPDSRKVVMAGIIIHKLVG